MSNNTISSPANLAQVLQAIPDQAVGVIKQSFEIIVSWEKLQSPSWFVIGGGDLRKLGNRIRKQPFEFMKIVHQTLQTARDGQILCQRGFVITKVLLGEEICPDEDKQQFTRHSLQEIRDTASGLSQHTNDMHSHCRTLRTGVLGIHTELNQVVEKRQRPSLSKRVEDLKTIGEGIEEIEKSLNFITVCWQTIASSAAYLQANSNSQLVAKQNTITLREIKNCYTKLDGYFQNYTEKISELYDLNVVNLANHTQKRLEQEISKGSAKSPLTQLKKRLTLTSTLTPRAPLMPSRS